MKILHTSDWHLGAYVGPQCDDPMKRMENTIECLKAINMAAIKERPDVILITGDIFHTAKVWADRALTEVRVAAQHIKFLCNIAPVVVLYGTPNHDGESQFKALQDMTPQVVYFTKPGIEIINTRSGIIQVAALPGFDKGHFRSQFPGLSAEEENVVFSQQLSQIVNGLSAQIDPDLPSVLMAHHTVAGCELDNGYHIFHSNEVLLDSNVLDNSAFDLICLGHIHKAQSLDINFKPVYYAGSIDAFTFNDEGHKKGFWIHDLSTHEHKFIETPAREFMTYRFDQEIMEGICQFGPHFLVKDKVVRILYTCNFETEKALDKKKIERDLYASGAYYVSDIRPESITEEVNKERLHEKLTVWDCLRRYLQERYPDIKDFAMVIDEAYPIITKIEAAIPAGGQTGIFLPLELSVKNYRSYKEETLNFQDIYFAMVNGKNGSGKSSLFMDAIVDCLYEQPREGELTGWIQNGEKSGSISFTFRLGNDTWRVVRTRQKSGKATLSLSKLVSLENQWEDHSAQKLVDTQDKIIQLLGMDADTFRSCVLIMQDQYGRFMEAKPENRMAVLASLLGLGIYEDLEKETKERLTDVNRELRQVKEEIDNLEQEVSIIQEIEDSKVKTENDLNGVKALLELIKQDRDETAAKIAYLGSLKKEKTELMKGIREGLDLISAKDSKRNELLNNVLKTKQFLSKEPELNQKHEEYQEVKAQLASLDIKASLYRDKKNHYQKLTDEFIKLQGEKDKLEKAINLTKDRLMDYDKLAAEIAIDKSLEDTLKQHEEKLQEYRETQSKISQIGMQIINIETKINYCKEQTKMLEQSGCIDIEQASCRFLKAAKDAKLQLEKLEDEKSILEDQQKIFMDSMVIFDSDKQIYEDLKKRVEDHRNKKQQLSILDGDKKLLDIHTSRLEELNSRIETLSSDIKATEDSLNTLKQEIADYDDLKARALELEKNEELWLKLPAGKQYLETVIPQLEELSNEISELQEAIKNKRDKVAEIERELVDEEKYLETLQEFDTQIRKNETLAFNLNKQLGSLEEKLLVLTEKKQILQGKKDSISNIAAKSARLQVLAEAFSQDGIPHQIIRDIVPELESSANEILGQMTGGRMRLEFRTERTLKSNKSKEVATLDIVIIDVDHGELSYLSRSGGQKVRAALAASFALAIIKASRVGLQLGMMFVDEPPFLDDEGVEAYCGALEAIHEKYPDMRIMAISHDENMKSAFPQQIYVEVTDQGSKIRR